MNYVESFNLLGIDAKQIPCINGVGEPTEATEGVVGCLYMNTENGNIYKCISINDGIYTWEQMDDIRAVLDKIANGSKQLFDYKKAVPFNGYLNVAQKKITSSPEVLSVSVPINVTEKTSITIHKELKTSRFMFATSTEENPTIGTALTYVSDKSGATGTMAYTNTITVEPSIKSLIILFWHKDTTYTVDEILKSIMVQFGSSYTGYEEYCPISFDADKINSLTDNKDSILDVASKSNEISTVLNRNNLGKSYMYDYMRNIADVANQYTKANALSFLWVTDTHTWEYNTYIGSLAAQMTKYFPCEYVAHTGDIIDGLTTVSEGLSTLTELNRNLMDANCPIFYVKGNHDDNCCYARENDKLAEHYILDSQLYARTLAFNKNIKTPIGNDALYYYYDDENTKIRSIFFNAYDCSEECDENGARLYDAKTQIFSDEQLNWLKNEALNFASKENSSEWAIMLFSHNYLHSSVYSILGDFQNGLDDFAEQGAGEVIAWFAGDDHLDMLRYYNWTYDNFTTTRLSCLNASSARDNTEDATEDNAVLYPPSKPANTENETAFDLVTVDRENHLIYLTRYGARSYAYNAETSKYDIIVSRTRIIDYTTGQYTKLVD